MCKCHSHGTFPLFGLQSSHLNICYYHQDLHRQPLRPGSRLGFSSNRRALLLIEAWYLPQQPGTFAPITKSDERFSRQYCCRPLPEFRLALPRSGIVHHLSGLDSPGLGHRHNLYRLISQADWWTGSHRSTSDQDTSPTPIRFPPDNFKHSLTLFSKSFSSFPRGTCSLSVSRPYLNLDGIYHPIRVAFVNRPTRQQRLVVRRGPGTTGLSPSLAPPSRGLGPGPPLRTCLQTTIWRPKATNFHGGLFPVRSPLLRESLQTCPQPNGFRRNLRSKTRWFTGFYNSHQVSHFATFFIDARAESHSLSFAWVAFARSPSLDLQEAPCQLYNSLTHEVSGLKFGQEEATPRMTTS
ncbi:hypothetical protein RJT34_16778 [Clitoria ternatea]|uniref:Protein TAR1 n=1 Tax=Clitoria ternatea TaxID=43366 RepID=A0AAN9PD51_CLITE